MLRSLLLAFDLSSFCLTANADRNRAYAVSQMDNQLSRPGNGYRSPIGDSKMLRIVAVFSLLVVACLMPQRDLFAQSPIWDVDGWDTAKLASVGITFDTYDHAMQSESPSREWVIIKFDCSRIPFDKPVLLTTDLVTDIDVVGSVRTERTNAKEQSLALRLTLNEMLLANSSIEINIWSPTPNGGNEAHGYRLSYKRILQLVREKQSSTQNNAIKPK